MAELIAPTTLINALYLIFPDFVYLLRKRPPNFWIPTLGWDPPVECPRKQTGGWNFARELHLVFNNFSKNFRPLACPLAKWRPLIGPNFAPRAQHPSKRQGAQICHANAHRPCEETCQVSLLSPHPGPNSGFPPVIVPKFWNTYFRLAPPCRMSQEADWRLKFCKWTTSGVQQLQ